MVSNTIVIMEVSLDRTTSTPIVVQAGLESHSNEILQYRPLYTAPAIPSIIRYTPISRSERARLKIKRWFVVKDAFSYLLRICRSFFCSENMTA